MPGSAVAPARSANGPSARATNPMGRSVPGEPVRVGAASLLKHRPVFPSRRRRRVPEAAALGRTTAGSPLPVPAPTARVASRTAAAPSPAPAPIHARRGVSAVSRASRAPSTASRPRASALAKSCRGARARMTAREGTFAKSADRPEDPGSWSVFRCARTSRRLIRSPRASADDSNRSRRRFASVRPVRSGRRPTRRERRDRR
jgi:hypothetical protein